MTDAKPAPEPDPVAPQPFTDDWFAARDKRDAMTDSQRQRYYR
jgi:hypothetical protein